MVEEGSSCNMHGNHIVLFSFFTLTKYDNFFINADSMLYI